jgi:RimJ/RimL family protein N-acetyltransferase
VSTTTTRTARSSVGAADRAPEEGSDAQHADCGVTGRTASEAAMPARAARDNLAGARRHGAPVPARESERRRDASSPAGARRHGQRVVGMAPADALGYASIERGAMVSELVLRDGTSAVIWPLLPTDAETLRDLFRRLSLESRRRRFLAAPSELDDTMMSRLVDSVDGVQHVALLLIVLPPDDEERVVGVARLLQYPADPQTADIAFAVADDWQGRGVGAALLSELMRRRPSRVERLCTVVQADNRASLALLAQAGRLSSSVAELGVVEVTVDLAAA